MPKSIKLYRYIQSSTKNLDLLETAKTGDIRKRLIKVNQTAKIIIVFKSANTMTKKIEIN